METDNLPETADPSEKRESSPEVLLAKAIWREQIRQRDRGEVSKEALKEDWAKNKRDMIFIARRVLRRIEDSGFALVPKA